MIKQGNLFQLNLTIFQFTFGTTLLGIGLAIKTCWLEGF
jgi:hypothetical protein